MNQFFASISYSIHLFYLNFQKNYKYVILYIMNGMYYLCRDGITIFLYFNQKIEN